MSPLNFGKTSLGSWVFDGATETGGGRLCDSVGGSRDPLEIVEGRTPPPVGVDARNNSIFCQQSITLATIASDSSILVSITSNSQHSRISLSIPFSKLSFPSNC